MSVPDRSAIPGELLVEPPALVALAVLVINDHWLKTQWPGTLAGKLSDFSGLVVFPLCLIALLEFGRRLSRHPVALPRDAPVAVFTCGVGFVFVKATDLGRDAYAWSVGTIRWPFEAAVAHLRGVHADQLQPIGVTLDPTDLVALIALVVPYSMILARARKTRENPSTPKDSN